MSSIGCLGSNSFYKLHILRLNSKNCYIDSVLLRITSLSVINWFVYWNSFFFTRCLVTDDCLYQ